MNTTIKEMKLGEHRIQLEFDEEIPQVVVDGKTYGTLDDLVKDAPDFFQKKNVREIAHIANFMFSGIRFEVIEDVERFCAHYQRQLKVDEDLRNYGVFDSKVIRQPYIENDKMVFFVEERATGLPFIVEGPFPYRDRAKPYSYRMLPYASR